MAKTACKSVYKKENTPWIMLLPLSFFLFFDFLQLNMMNSTSHFIMPYLHNSNQLLGIVSSLFFWFNLLFLLPAGYLLDKYSPRWLLTNSIIITILGIAIFIIKPSVLSIMLWRALSGIGGAFSYLSCVKILACFFPRKILGLLLGLTGIVIMTAGACAQYPLLFLYQNLGLRITLGLDCAFAIVVCVFILIFIQNSQNKIRISPKQKSPDTVYFRIKNWVTALYAAFTNFPLFILGALWCSTYLINQHNIPLNKAMMISSMIYIGNIIGAPSLGALSDYYGSRKPFMIFSALIYFASMLMIINITTQSYFIFLTLFFVLGISTGAQTLAYANVVEINEPNQAAKATSLLSLLSVGGAALVQPLFGYIVDSSTPPNYQQGMYIIVLTSLLSVILAFLVTSKSSEH